MEYNSKVKMWWLIQAHLGPGVRTQLFKSCTYGLNEIIWLLTKSCKYLPWPAKWWPAKHGVLLSIKFCSKPIGLNNCLLYYFWKMRSFAEFLDVVETSSYEGKIGLVVKFTITPGKEAEFETVFRPAVSISVKEKGCIKEKDKWTSLTPVHVCVWLNCIVEN